MLRFHRRRNPYGVTIPLTSLIDVVFLLLVYFLLTTNFMADEGIKVNLPRAQTAASALDPEVTVYVEESGKVYLEAAEIDVPALLGRLRTLLSERQDRIVVIKADRLAVVDRVVEVMDVAKAAGAHRLLLATERTL